MIDVSETLLTITVNGQPVETEPGRLLIHVLQEQGIDIPTLCHDDRLRPYGGCRLCLVARKDDQDELITSCTEIVQDGMIIETDNEEVIEARRQQLQLLALNHRMECPICERHGDCRFQDLVFRYGTPEEMLPFELVRHPKNTSSPVITRDPEKCILCDRCVRVCREVQGVEAISMVDRGLQAKITPLVHNQFDCEFCGQCVNICPVGALVSQPFAGNPPAYLCDAETTTCGYCSCGCQVEFQVYEDRISRIGADLDVYPNDGRLCVKGWLGQDLHHSEQRLTKPLIRRDGELIETSWDEALDAATRALADARDSEKAIVGLGSARLTTEDAYQMQYLMRAVLGTPHVGAESVGGRDGLVDGLAPVTGQPCSTATFEDLADADLAIVLRADPSRTHPLVKTELTMGVRQHGQRVVLASALTGSLDYVVTDDLQITPGTDGTLLAGLAHRMLKTLPSLEETPFRDWANRVAEYTPERVGEITGLTPERIESVASAIEQARSIVFVVVCAAGIPGDEAVIASAAATFAAVLDRDDDREVGVLLLGEKANTQGVLDAGLDPDYLPGARPVADAEARAEVERVWGAPLPSGAGWSMEETLARAAAGDVGLLYLAGRNPEAAWQDPGQTREMIERSGFVIVQDAFLTEAAAMADLVLPVAILAERAGTLVGADGVDRPLRPVMQAPGRVPQDGRIFAELAKRLGTTLPEDAELDTQIDALVNTPVASDTSTYHVPPSPAAMDKTDGLWLDVSPQLFHSGSMTRYSEQLCSLAPLDDLWIAPADAARLRIASGQNVRVTLGEREQTLRARVSTALHPGTVASIWNELEKGVKSLSKSPYSTVKVTIEGMD